MSGKTHTAKQLNDYANRYNQTSNGVKQKTCKKTNTQNCWDSSNAFSTKTDSIINVKAEFGQGDSDVLLDNIVKRAKRTSPKKELPIK